MLRPRLLTVPAVLAAVAALATGCGSGTPSPKGTSDVGAATLATGGGAQLPGASGTIAAVSGKVAQVQSAMSGQVAVTFTSSTKITAQVTARRSDVEIGSCVLVRSASSGTSAPTQPPSKVTATSVSITAASGTSCGRGARGGTGAPQGRPTGMPTDLPSDLPSNLQRGARPVGLGVMGEVTAVNAHGFTVASTGPGSSTTDVAVTTTGATTYTQQESAGLSAVTTGRCLTAMGHTDSTGGVTATTASVSDPVDGECTMGFGGARAEDAS
ncbi:hypothetical protein [Nocardioides montaniterrae]